MGYAVLSDDIVALVDCGQEFKIFPAYPRLSLWPDSVKLLYGSPDALPQIIPGWEKRYLGLGEDGKTRFEERALPIGCIYVLENSTASPTENLEPISRKTALMLLVGNTYATNFLDGKQRGAELEVLSQLVVNVPVRKISRGREAAGIEELCAAILLNFGNIGTQTNPRER
jgi:hypothetical protein